MDPSKWKLVKDKQRFHLITLSKHKLLCTWGLKKRSPENLDTALSFETDFSSNHS